MNKKILSVFVCLLISAILLTPVFAVPTAGQKMEVVINWSNWSVITEDPVTTPGGITHNTIEGTWDVEIVVTDGPTYTGTSETTRYVTVVPKEGGADLIIKEDYEMTVNGGGFVGSGLIIIKGYTGAAPPWDVAKAHGLLQGTGDLDGQTINAGHGWVPPGPIQWTGYILKP